MKMCRYKMSNITLFESELKNKYLFLKILYLKYFKMALPSFEKNL